jgi:hypothetical protein
VPRIDAKQIATNRLGLAQLAGPVKIERRLQRW